MMNAADQALRDGRPGHAIVAYEQLLAIDPNRPDAWFNRAWAERAERRFSEALASYRAAIEAGITRPQEAHLNRAAILSDHLFRSEEAAAELRSALRIDPDFIPAWLSLGTIHEDLGHVDEACRVYRTVLELDRLNGRAHSRLAAIAILRGDAPGAAERVRLALPGARTVADRADMLFALGTALDACGDFDDAFQAIEAANWCAWSMASGRYDAGAERLLVDRLIATFDSAPVIARNGDDQSPVFVCGMFRSGSTLAEQMLARHSAVIAGGELEGVPAITRGINPYPEAVPLLSAGALATLRGAYLRESAAIGEGLITDKRCDNYVHIGLIKTLFPAARIIHTVRHPLDMLLSAWFLNFGDAVRWSHDLGEAARHYAEYHRLMAHWRTLWPDDIHDVSYDRMVSDPRGEMGCLLDWLGLPWEEACLGDAPIEASVRTASTWAVRQPLSTRSSGRWRNYERHLVGVRETLNAHGVAI